MGLERIMREAEEAVRERRVKLYVFRPSGRRRWIVVGKRRDYLVLPDPNYCSCDDFFFRVLSHEKPTCYHLEAVRLAAKEKKYEIIEEDDQWHTTLMNEWLGRRER